jgi:hypothetical protein
MARKKTDIVKLQLRLEESLRRDLAKAATAKSQSMNSEIIERLERSFFDDKTMEIIELMMWLQRTENRNWKDDTRAAELLRIALDRIIAGVAGLPSEHQRRTENEDPEKWGNAEVLAATVLRKFGYRLPSDPEKGD